MAKRKRGDWVPVRGWGARVSLTPVSQSVDFILVRPTTDENPADDAEGRVEAGAQILTQRCIGQIRLENYGEDPLFCGMRIRTGIYDDNLDQAAFFATSLVGVADANEPFLWNRYVVVGPGEDTFDPLFHPWWSSLDVRVARKLDRGTALFLSVEAFPFAGQTDTLLVTPYVRTWARALM